MARQFRVPSENRRTEYNWHITIFSARHQYLYQKRGIQDARDIYICIIWKRVVAENDNRKSLGDQSLSCVCDVTNDNDNNNNWKEFEKEKSLFPCNKDIVFFRSFV